MRFHRAKARTTLPYYRDREKDSNCVWTQRGRERETERETDGNCAWTQRGRDRNKKKETQLRLDAERERQKSKERSATAFGRREGEREKKNAKGMRQDWRRSHQTPFRKKTVYIESRRGRGNSERFLAANFGLHL